MRVRDDQGCLGVAKGAAGLGTVEQQTTELMARYALLSLLLCDRSLGHC